MISIGRHDGAAVTLSLREGSATISVERAGGLDAASFDGAGRLWTAFFDGVAYRRGLDGRILARWRPTGDARQRRWLAAGEALALEDRARGLALAGLKADFAAPPTREALAALDRAAAFETARSLADAAEYGRVYTPVGILPPDQYMALVVQATEGCAFNTCTFCDFYRERPFRIKSPADFRAHAEAVRAFVGGGLSLRRSIFLGDANALVIPMPRLLALFDIVNAVFDGAPGGIYAFLDGFSGEKKRADDYRLLVERGLRRVYIGLESGSDDLLRFLHKPGSAGDVLAAVRAIKAGGAAVGLIVLLGAGGTQHNAAHVRDTAALLNAMPLDGGDILYLSELVVGDNLPYGRQSAEAGLTPLTPAQCRAQGERIAAALTQRPRISRYDIREFVY